MGAENEICNEGFFSTKGLNPVNNEKQSYCEACPVGYYCLGGD